MSHRLTVTAAAATAAASLAIYPLVEGTSWFWAGAGAVAVAAAMGTLTRLRALPAAVCLLAALAGLYLYLNLVFAGPQSLYRLLPTLASLHHLDLLVAQGSADTARYAPPAPATPGILLLATAGIGVTAAVTDLIGVRLRRPAVAGLPLLVLFCVPLTTDARPGSYGAALVFCLAVTGYLALLSAEGRERVRLWGRLVRAWPGTSESPGPDTRQLSAAGRRIGSAAVVLALCLPLLLPELQHHRLFPGSGTGQGGGTVVSLPDPLVQLNDQLHQVNPETVLTYHTGFLSTPPYFQIYVLSKLATNDWSLAPPSSTTALAGGRVPAVPGLSATTPAPKVTEVITLGTALKSGQDQLTYLPVPYAPRLVTVPGTWRAVDNSLSIVGSGVSLGGLRYTVSSLDVSPSSQQLARSPAAPADVQRADLQVPAIFRRQLTPLVRQITAGRKGLYRQAVALQAWFTKPGNFTYTLNVSQPRNADDLINFLTRTKRGYCQQFAFAMAVMARLLGIPSRVVVGYTQGTYRGGDTWEVRTSDAHAWPELYFQGAGWLRFEPTPSGSSVPGGQATATVPAYTYLPSKVTPAPPGAPAGATASPGHATGTSSKLSPKLRRLGPGGATYRRHRRPAAPAPAGLIAIVVLAVAAATPRTARTLLRHRRWLKARDDAGRAHAAWSELRDDLADHQVACRASESPRALAHRLGTTLDLAPAPRAALERIAIAEERASYAASPMSSGQLRADVTTVRRAVAGHCGPRIRLTAAVLPLSTLRPARVAAQNALDVFGWMDVITSSLRDRVTRRRPSATQF